MSNPDIPDIKAEKEGLVMSRENQMKHQDYIDALIHDRFIGNEPDVINVGDDDLPKWVRMPEEEPSIDLEKEINDLP